MKEGFQFILDRQGMLQLIVVSFCMSALWFPLAAALPGFVQQVFQQGPKTYTLLLMCSGAGSVAGGLMVAAKGKVHHQGRAALMIVTVLGASIAGFAVSRTLPLSCVLIFAVGVTAMSSASLLLSLAQVSVGDEMRGRVMSVFNLSFRSGMPLGSLLLGLLIPVFGVSATLATSGSILVALALYFLILHRGVAAL